MSCVASIKKGHQMFLQIVTTVPQHDHVKARDQINKLNKVNKLDNHKHIWPHGTLSIHLTTLHKLFQEMCYHSCNKTVSTPEWNMYKIMLKKLIYVKSTFLWKLLSDAWLSRSVFLNLFHLANHKRIKK